MVWRAGGRWVGVPRASVCAGMCDFSVFVHIKIAGEKKKKYYVENAWNGFGFVGAFPSSGPRDDGDHRTRFHVKSFPSQY